MLRRLIDGWRDRERYARRSLLVDESPVLWVFELAVATEKQPNHSNFIASCRAFFLRRIMRMNKCLCITTFYSYACHVCCVYHTHRHRGSLWCYSTRHTHAISSNGQSERWKKKCSKKPVRTNKKQHLLERFYASRRHKHIWHFNASASTVFLFVVVYSISLAKVFISVVLNIIPTCKWISLIWNQNEKMKTKNESFSKDRAFLWLSETVSILHLFLPLLGQFITY